MLLILLILTWRLQAEIGLLGAGMFVQSHCLSSCPVGRSRYISVLAWKEGARAVDSKTGASVCYLKQSLI